MKFSNLKTEKGVAGTTVLLGLIVSLFVIGLLVMIFALMGGSLQNASYSTNTTTLTNVSDHVGAVVFINQTGFILIDANKTNFVLSNVSAVWGDYNSTVNGNTTGTIGGYNVSIPYNNVTFTSNGILRNATVTTYTNVSVTYLESYSINNTATGVIENTTVALSSTTNFFTLFIVIGSMVVLILLTVIIIVAIRQSGLLSGGTG